MDWSAKIFAYCERGHDAGFWAEPVNAVTNIAFIFASFTAFTMWSRREDRASRLTELALILLVAVIGVGSFLFHTFATRWAALGDVVPITVFMLAYLSYSLVRFLLLKPYLAAIATVIFFLSLPATGLAFMGLGRGFFAGSASYLPALCALVIIGSWLFIRRHAAGIPILCAALVFSLSLALRTVDTEVCQMTPVIHGARLGTHFAWHLLNAALLYILLQTALRHGAKQQPK